MNTPTIGMGATIQIGSDSYPATIIQVERNGHRIILQHDTYIRLDYNGMSESQTYRYEPNPQGDIEIATLRNDGTYRLTGKQTTVLLGERDRYYDYRF